MTYIPRVMDHTLREYLTGSRAISIEGPRAVGKTRTASRVAHTVLRLDDPATREVLAAQRETYLASQKPPVLIDEWQLDPPVWDAVRRLVDDDPVRGRFILTGSVNQRDAPVHPGAGRFLRLRMRPLSVFERQLEQPTVSLAALLEGGAEIHGRTSIGLEAYAREIVDSGFPGIRDEPPSVRRRAVADYTTHVIEHDVPELGGLQRRPQSLRSWLVPYAAASSTTSSLEKIATAATDAVPAKATISMYRETLTRLWLLDEVPAWTPTGTGIPGLGRAPKHQLADPALAASILGAGPEALLQLRNDADVAPRLRALRNASLIGALFESLVTLSVRVYAAPTSFEVSHLRTHRGDHEVDLILHSDDGRVLAIEVKLASSIGDGDARHLNWLHDALGAQLVDKVVVTTGADAYRRRDGVAVVPLALLGP